MTQVLLPLIDNKTLKTPLQISIIVTIFLLLSACFATPQTKQLQDQPLSLPTQIEHAHTPFYPQNKYHCGPAALATALDSIKHHYPLTDIVQKVYLPGRKGTLKSDLLSATRRYQLIAYQLKPELKFLLTELSKGNVVIVFQNLGVKYIPRWHYAVAIGYDLHNNTIILRSGKHKRRVTKLALFERTWKRSGYWAIVVTPATKIPATATALQWMIALSLYEKDASHPQSVKQAYRIALKRWPQHSLLHLTSANYWFQQKSWYQARRYYYKAVTLDSQNADAWNNYANLQLTLKRYQAALISSRKAIRIGGRNLSAYKRTLQEIQQKISTSKR
ncbi:hypothetical protein MNBD_GAMMA12-336 [hydrothermal vent metagenome]|uniref:Peptidase C39 domain-containing protein n=1 Tax=hydrothermal vent metagenome TaxID=652676 RepID=A0A3B0Y5S2_9ZZZZ